MSIFPRQYHGPEVKCSGSPSCEDCRLRAEQGLTISDFTLGGLKLELALQHISWPDLIYEQFNVKISDACIVSDYPCVSFFD